MTYPVAEPARHRRLGQGPRGLDPGRRRPGDEVTVSSVANPPGQEEGSAFSAHPETGDADEGASGPPLGIAILILFADPHGASPPGLPLKAAIAAVLVSDVPERLARRWHPPTARETAALARDVQWRSCPGPPPTGTVASPVQPWSSAEPGGTPRRIRAAARRALTPSSVAQAPARTPGCRCGKGEDVGWVHRSTVADWHREVITRPHPPTGRTTGRPSASPEPFETRDPTGVNFTRRDAGELRPGSPRTGGNRPVYSSTGQLIGDIPADKVPPSSLTKDIAPPPPPPPPPAPERPTVGDPPRTPSGS